MTYYVCSTATNSTYYCMYYPTEKGQGLNRIQKRVLINGGHGVAKNADNVGIWTPNGVTTAVSDEDMAFLQQNETFMRHVKKGFITFSKKQKSEDKLTEDMNPKDRSAPYTMSDYARGDYSEDETPTLKRIKIV